MKAPIGRPSYAFAGSRRDRPRVLPADGQLLRRRLAAAGLASETDLAAAAAVAAAATALKTDEAPNDGQSYARKSGGWQKLSTAVISGLPAT